MKHHLRVIPRDFFNEAKLLKCLGKIELTILDQANFPLKSEFEGGPFEIFQNPNDGSLEVINYKVYLGPEEVQLFTPLNSKENWPLYAMYKGQEYCIFNEKGEFIPSILTEKSK